MTTNPAHSEDKLLSELAKVRAHFHQESLKQYMARPLTRGELFERVIAEDLATMKIPQEQLNKMVTDAYKRWELDNRQADGVE